MLVTTIQRLLGHHDLRTTQRYAHVMDKTAQQQYHAAMARIEQVLSPAPLFESSTEPCRAYHPSRRRPRQSPAKWLWPFPDLNWGALSKGDDRYGLLANGRARAGTGDECASVAGGNRTG